MATQRLAARHRRGSRRRARGTTLFELGAALGIASAIIAGVLTLAGAIRAGVEPIAVGKRVGPWIEVMHRNVVHWYRSSYCHAGATPPPYPISVTDADAEAACEADAAACVAAFVPPPLARLQPAGEREDGVFRWRLATPNAPDGVLPPPRLQITWTPPSHLRRDTPILARELRALCDDDRDADTVEPCSASSRIVWDGPLDPRQGAALILHSRLVEWLARNAVDCDADGDGEMDPFCDGQTIDSRLDADVALDLTGDGCDDAHAPAADSGCTDAQIASNLADRDGDGRLDFDANGDLAVDREDFRALGC